MRALWGWGWLLRVAFMLEKNIKTAFYSLYDICTAQHTSSRAQNFNDKLFGGEYTYIEFVATKPHQYPVFFAALSTKDTIIYKSIFCFIFLLTFTALLWQLWL